MANIRFLQDVTLYNSITTVSSITSPIVYGKDNKLTLKSDSALTSDQYIIIEPTASTDVHIRAGGDIDASTASIFVGGEKTYLKVSDSLSGVYIKTTDDNNSELLWSFGKNGTLTLPLTSDIKFGQRSIINDPQATTLTVSNSSVLSGSVCVGINAPISGAKLSVKGNLIVDGSITATGSATFVNTVFTTTSSLSVKSYGTGPALVVNQEGDQAVAAFYDHESAIGLWVDGDSARPGYVGIKTDKPNKALTVVGDISATGKVYANGTINKFISAFGDTSNLTYTITHDLNVEDVVVSIVDTTTKEVVYPSVTNTALNQITVSFSEAPGLTAYKAIIIG